MVGIIRAFILNITSCKNIFLWWFCYKSLVVTNIILFWPHLNDQFSEVFEIWQSGKHNLHLCGFLKFTEQTFGQFLLPPGVSIAIWKHTGFGFQGTVVRILAGEEKNLLCFWVMMSWLLFTYKLILKTLVNDKVNTLKST